MGRLVASNSACFASGPASRLLPTKSTAASERTDDSTSTNLSRTGKESKGFLGLYAVPCSGRHTTAPPCDISAKLDIADFAPGAAGAEQAGNGVRLVMPHLQHNPTVWNHGRNSRNKATKDVEAVAPPIERLPRIETANVRFEIRDLGRAHIGRIANQNFKTLVDVLKRVACQPMGAILDAKTASVVACHCQRRRADVGADADGIGKLAKKRQQQAPGPGADIQNAQRRSPPSLPAHPFERRLDQRLAVWARIECCGRDGEAAAVEFPLAQDARDRLAGAAPGDAPFQPLDLLRTAPPLRLAEDLG